MKKHLYHKKAYIVVTVICLLSISCKKLVDVEPPSTRVTAGNVFTNDETAIAVLNGIYTTLSSSNYSSNSISLTTLSMYAGLSADELELWPGGNNIQFAYYRNTLKTTVAGSEFWSAYSLIYSCNAAIEGLGSSTSLTPSVKNQLLGEAKFVRSLLYFYLTNLFGDVPLVLTTDYKVNSSMARTSQSLIYTQIITDLLEAQTLMKDGFVRNDANTLYPGGAAERVRPSKAAAIALLSKAYLFTKDYKNAEIQASNVISNTSLFALSALNDVFLKNSTEAIWQLQPVSNGQINNTADGFAFNLSISPNGVNDTHPVFLSQSLLNSFEAGDKRKLLGNWINVYTDPSGTYYYPFKYKDPTNGTGISPTEYSMVLRLGEIYLIRAESRARQNQLALAISDVDMIRQRAGLPLLSVTLPGISQSALLDKIQHERQVELFTESGARWIDLKRSGVIDQVMPLQNIVKGSSWSTHQQLYPLPIYDLSTNSNLIQNPGY